MSTAQIKQRGRAAIFLTAIMAAVVAVILSLSAFTSTAYAGGGGGLQIIYKGTHKYAMLVGAGDEANTLVYVSDAYKPITKCKSSNKQVATVKVTKYAPEDHGGYTIPGYYTLSVTLKKAGTTKITYYYKGKKHTATFKVQKYVNPIKSFKLGSKEYKKCFNAKNLFMNPRVGYPTTLSTGKIQGKLKITPASGWKINRIYYGSEQTNNVERIKNGATVSKNFTVEMKNKKTGFIETFAIQPDFKLFASSVESQQSKDYLQAASFE